MLPAGTDDLDQTPPQFPTATAPAPTTLEQLLATGFAPAAAEAALAACGGHVSQAVAALVDQPQAFAPATAEPEPELSMSEPLDQLAWEKTWAGLNAALCAGRDPNAAADSRAPRGPKSTCWRPRRGSGLGGQVRPDRLALGGTG